MAPKPPILSTSLDLDLPDLDKILSSSTIPASSDLLTLNDSLADLAASAQARADALRRDLELLQHTYATLKSKIQKEKEESKSEPADESKEISYAPAMKKRKSEIGHGGQPLPKKPSQGVRWQHSPSDSSSALLPDGSSSASDLLATSDPEEMKRRLGVAYYPTIDLTPLLPGVPSMEDYSKQKIPNQVAMSTFLASVDPFYRAFTEEDLGWLRERGDRLEPFIIPPLGTHYLELWNEVVDETPPPRQDSTQKARESCEDLTDETIQSDNVSCGPLTSRLLSAFIKEDDINGTNSEDVDQADKEKNSRLGTFKMDYPELEDKLITELNFIGLLDVASIDWTQSADDEIAANLRALQNDLHQMSATNFARKQKLMNLTTDEMAKDEYTTILDDLDKQVEQAFLKRNRSIKATKKKRGPGEKGIAVTKVSIGSNIRSLMEKRQRWIQRIGSICTTDPVSEESIFQSLDQHMDSP